MKAKNDASRLRELLARAGLSQRTAARELSVSERTMHYYVAGEQPIPRTVTLALEYLTGDQAFFAGLAARARREAACQCGKFEITTYESAEPNLSRSIDGMSPGTCDACSDGATTRAALRLLGVSDKPVIRPLRAGAKRARAKK